MLLQKNESYILKIISLLCVVTVLFTVMSAGIFNVSANTNGWQTTNGKTYYYINGNAAKGWQNLNGRRYFFDDSGVLSSQFGIDVSHHQGSIDWKKAKADGVEFAMIRIGYRGYGDAGTLNLDTRFNENIKNALAEGIDCGVYFFSQSITAAEARAEANFVLTALKNANIKPSDLAYPVAFDIEDAILTDPTHIPRTLEVYKNKTLTTNMCIAFSDTIKSAGYKPMIYASRDWLLNKLEISRLSPAYEIWLAHWVTQTNYTNSYKIWQYTDKGKVDGVPGNVDLNVSLHNLSSNANLTNIRVNDVRIPNFSANKTSYSYKVPNSVTKVTLAAARSNTKAKTSGLGEKTNLKVGNNNFNIVVTAENGTKKTYKVNIIREPKAYTVTFMVDGKRHNRHNVQSGKAAKTPKVPKKKGHTFRKWSRSFNKVTKNLTINAVFRINEYTVTFKDGNNTLGTQKIEYNGKVSFTPAKNGFRFVSWYTTRRLKTKYSPKKSRVTKNITLHARYKR